MKFIVYRVFKDDQNNVDTFGVLLMYLRDAQQCGGVDFESMGRRIDLIKRIRALEPKAGKPNPDGFTVDESEYTLLRQIEKYRFPFATEFLYEIIGDVLNAKEKVQVVPTKANE